MIVVDLVIVGDCWLDNCIVLLILCLIVSWLLLECGVE